MRLAFYAPLKAPDHPTPSGDRAMAQALIHALSGIGARVDLASSLRSREGRGNELLQDNILQQAKSEITRITREKPDWQAWITYHNYYKAPDLIGPAVARHLGIPYLLIEATRARKRLAGPWARFATAAETACDAAHTILYLTERDSEALRRDAPPGQTLMHLRPFLDRDSLPLPGQRRGAMLAVGMMREGDKLASYRVIADTLAHMPGPDWRLDIAGDGAARAEVEALMAPYGARIRFLGALDPLALSQHYQDAALLLWPGVNEAFGMTYLEAQAHGLPVVAQDRPGVRDVLAPGTYPTPETGPEPLAARAALLLRNSVQRIEDGDAARAYIRRTHLRDGAEATLSKALKGALT